MKRVTREERALQRRVLLALDKSGGMPVVALCKPAYAPSRVVLRVLEGLAREGHVEEHRPGLWRTTRNLRKGGGVGRRGPTCKCGGYAKRAFSAGGDAEWCCGRCDNRWPRITRRFLRTPRRQARRSRRAVPS